LADVIEQSGFQVNTNKTKLMRFTQRQRVTGLIVNQKLNIPRSYIRGLGALLHIWAVHGEEDAVQALERARPMPNWPPEKPSADFRSVVRGQVNLCGLDKGMDGSRLSKACKQACGPR
jgi:RNA-directed DNA polymerase